MTYKDWTKQDGENDCKVDYTLLGRVVCEHEIISQIKWGAAETEYAKGYRQKFYELFATPT